MEFSDPTEFRSRVDPLLMRNEARNSLFLGITGTLIDRPDVYEDFFLWAVLEGEMPIAAGAMTPPHNLLLADDATEISMSILAEHVVGRGFDLPGAQGTIPTVEHFCRTWSELNGVDTEIEVELGIHELTRVAMPPDVAGGPRPATTAEVDLLVDWLDAFLDEADPAAPKTDLEDAVRKKLGLDPALGGTWLWEVDGEPVALSGYGGRTPNGIRIGPVYTPPKERGQGFATALVAAQSSWLLEQGRSFCFLFTDLANPTSNSIYRRIGYRKVGHARRYGFTDSNRSSG